MSQASPHPYHRETIAHLGLDVPGPADEVLARLDGRERACGVPFPAAVREWYALPVGLAEPDLYFDGELIPLEELGDPFPHWLPDWPRHPLGLAGTGRLPVMVEDHGDCLWAVDLDGSDDPPVSVAQYGSIEPGCEVLWAPHAESFSSFILGMCWVNAWIHRAGSHMLLMHQRPDGRPLSTGDVAPLRTRLAEGPRTVNRPRGFMATRFTGPGVAIEIRDLPQECAARGDEDHRVCHPEAFARAGGPVRRRDWLIKAASDEALVRLAGDLRGWGLLDRRTSYISCFPTGLDATIVAIRDQGRSPPRDTGPR